MSQLPEGKIRKGLTKIHSVIDRHLKVDDQFRPDSKFIVFVSSNNLVFCLSA
jgi:hypothetical protein